MMNADALPRREALAALFRWYPIGDGTAVVCDHCNGAIQPGTLARFYGGNAVHAPDTYRIHRVYHPDCGGIDLIDDDAVGGQSATPEDDVQGVGVLVHEPGLPDTRPDPDALEAQMRERFGDSVRVHALGDRARHRLAHAVITARQYPGERGVETYDVDTPDPEDIGTDRGRERGRARGHDRDNNDGTGGHP